jgi:hypothetical protein
MVLLGIAVFALLIYGGYLVIIMVFRKLSGNAVALPFDMPLPSWLKGIEQQFSNIFSFFQEFLRRFKDAFAQGEKWV